MSALRLLLCILPVIAIAVADDTQEKFETARNECISETKVSRDLADGLKEGKFVEDAKLKEYIFCVNKKIGYQNENGDFDYDVVRKVLRRKYSDETIDKIFDKCTEKKSTPQEAAYHTLKCGYEVAHSN